jgi:hypothetical protein
MSGDPAAQNSVRCNYACAEMPGVSKKLTMKRTLILLLLFASTCQPQSWIVRSARVFDGQRVIGTPDVLITSGKIVAIGPRLRATRGTQIIDGHGRTLLPGFIDSHVHLTGCDTPGCRPDESVSLLKTALFGVTTAIDLGGTAQGFTARAILERARQAPVGHFPEFMTAGVPITIKGGHGIPRGRSTPIPTLDDAAGAQAFIDARIAEGSQIIKIIYEDLGGSVPRMPRATMKVASKQRICGVNSLLSKGVLALNMCVMPSKPAQTVLLTHSSIA